MPSRNSETLRSFVTYCHEHPNERFWQALRNWAGVGFIFVGVREDDFRDTFYWEGKDA